MEDPSETDDACKYGNVVEMCRVVYGFRRSRRCHSQLFVSVVMGVMTGVFGIWMGHEHKGDNNVTSTDLVSSNRSYWINLYQMQTRRQSWLTI